MEHEPTFERVGPMDPSELLAEKVLIIPNEVFVIFNSLIAENAMRGVARVNQFDVVGRLEELGFDRKEIYKKKWLDVEELYRKKGWSVEYDKPGWNETYEPYFIFSAIKKAFRNGD